MPADPRAPARAQQSPPDVGPGFFQQENFKIAAGLKIASAQTRRDDARIVQHKDIPVAQIVQQSGKLPVLDGLGIPARHQQARLVAGGGGPGGDQPGRDLDFEIGGAQSRQHGGAG
jgi:hypothetical protein